jgi:predicted helicase
MTGLFSDFYQSLDADPVKRGRQFEHVVKWFLTDDPAVVDAGRCGMALDEYPERWGADCGIDLMFRHRNGEALGGSGQVLLTRLRHHQA